MSERSIFPNNVEVKQANLEYTETTKGEQDRKRLLDSQGANAPAGGRVEGLVISVTGAATTFSVSAGRGYTANGELVELTATSNGNSLSDETLDVVNNVYLAYTEIETSPQPHETDGTTRNTRIEAVTTVVALTQAEFDALPATDSNYLNNAQDRMLKLGEITGAGVGINIPTANVSQQSLPLVSVFEHVQAKFSTDTHKGVEITFAGGNPAGTGTLTLSAGGTTGVQATWVSPAPGDTPGSAVDVPRDGGPFVAASSAANLLFLRGAADSAVLGAYSVDITTLYRSASDERLMLSRDYEHREATNPHGIQGPDLGTSLVNLAPIFITEADNKPAEAAQLTFNGELSSGLGWKHLVNVTESIGGTDAHLYFGTPAGGTALANGLAAAVNVEFDGTNWVNTDGTNFPTRVVFGDSNNNRALSVDVRGAGLLLNIFDEAGWNTAFGVGESLGDANGLVQIGTGDDSGITAALEAPLIQLNAPYPDAPGTTFYTPLIKFTDNDASENTIKGALYRRTDGTNTSSLQLVTGAEWNSGTNQWNQLAQADDPFPLRMRFEQVASQDIATAGIYFESSSATPSFSEASWRTKIRIPPGTLNSVEFPDGVDFNGVLLRSDVAGSVDVIGGNLRAALDFVAFGNYTYNTVRTVTVGVPCSSVRSVSGNSYVKFGQAFLGSSLGTDQELATYTLGWLKPGMVLTSLRIVSDLDTGTLDFDWRLGYGLTPTFGISVIASGTGVAVVTETATFTHTVVEDGAYFLEIEQRANPGSATFHVELTYEYNQVHV